MIAMCLILPMPIPSMSSRSRSASVFSTLRPSRAMRRLRSQHASAPERYVLADLARDAHYRLHTGLAAPHVVGECDVHFVIAGELFGEHRGVFHRHAGALADVRRHGVRRVAKEYGLVPRPVPGPELLDVGGDDLMRLRQARKA